MGAWVPKSGNLFSQTTSRKCDKIDAFDNKNKTKENSRQRARKSTNAFIFFEIVLHWLQIQTMDCDWFPTHANINATDQ